LNGTPRAPSSSTISLARKPARTRTAIVAGETSRSCTASAIYTLEHLLADLALKSGGRPPTEGGGVKVATLHATKGVQWPTVYLVGLEEGRLPDYRVTTAEQPAEERRACFVGVCRAEDTLILTWSRRFRTMRQTPSRFLRRDAADLTLLQALVPEPAPIAAGVFPSPNYEKDPMCRASGR
jgi:DNA helicase-2/ATP-dependent DNA helicase PcrA